MRYDRVTRCIVERLKDRQSALVSYTAALANTGGGGEQNENGQSSEGAELMGTYVPVMAARTSRAKGSSSNSGGAPVGFVCDKCV